MDLIEALQTRKSIRAFKPDPVPQKVIKEILGIACRAPSAMNIQPWEFLVLTGNILEEIGKENVKLLNSGTPPSPEHLVVGWTNESVYRLRQVGLAKQLFRLMDIPREDKVKRAWWLERGFRHFDAPVSIVILTDRSLVESTPLLDLGAVMQNICLAAMGFNLGTCIEDQSVMYPQVLRKAAGIPDSKRIIIGIAIGYPDMDFPANRVESAREPVDNITTWCGYD
ncbi:MAG: nitroreductase [Spirochaetota bacterium]|nr:nitroreductase [Spirochaetota bacterium]